MLMVYEALEVMNDILGHDLPSIDNAMSRSLIDTEYRQRLLQDARAAFAEEGVNFPDGVMVTCHEVDLNDRHFFLPPMVSDPTPIPADEVSAGARNRPKIAPDDPPIRGSIRPGVARPFLLGTNYPGPSPKGDQADPRW
jgi:hypothetical protein